MKIKRQFAAVACVLVLLSTALFVLQVLDDNSKDTPTSKLRKKNREVARDFGKTADTASNDSPHSFELEISKKISEQSINDREKIEPDPSQDKQHWQVVTWMGKPCVGAKVFATEISHEIIESWLTVLEEEDGRDPHIYETESRLDGSFVLLELEAKIYCVLAKANGFAYSCDLLDLSGGWISVFTIKVGREKKINGIVVDGSGAPVEGVELYRLPFLSSDLTNAPLEEACEFMIYSPSTITDAKGGFQFEMLPIVDFRLYSEHQGYMSINKTVPSFDNNLQKIILKKPCIVKGKVLDENGEPVEGASVQYRHSQGGTLLADPIKTDEEGTFCFNDAPEGVVSLQAIHEEHGNAAQRVEVKPDVENEQNITLTGGISLKIMVVEPNGSPLNNADILVKDYTTGAFLGRTYSDENGNAEINGINNNSLNFIRVMDKKNHYSKYTGIHSFSEGESSLSVELRKRIMVRMKVIDSETEVPIKEYKACVFPYFTSTGVEERSSLQRFTTEFESEKEIYEILVGKDEVFGFIFDADGYVPKKVMINYPGDHVNEIPILEVSLDRGGDLNGSVVDATDGKSISDARVQIYAKGCLNNKPIHPMSLCKSAKTGDDGTFRIDGISEVPFYLKVQAIGYAPTIVSSGELDSDGSPSVNVIKLWTGCTLSGTVLDENEYPLEGAVVRVIPYGTDEAIVTKTHPDGTYIMTGLPTGEVEVLVEHYMAYLKYGANMKLSECVALSPGVERVLNFRFSGSCSIVGVCSYDGELGHGVQIDVINSTGKKICTAHSTFNGNYKIFGIPAGGYDVNAISTLAGLGGSCSQSIELSEGEVINLDIDLANKAVHGQVRGPDDSPIHGAIVELLSTSLARSHKTFTDQRGKYTILSVEEGTYSISTRAENCAETISGPWPIGGSHPVKKADFSLEAGGIGRVVITDQKGKPLTGALVHLAEDFSKGPLQSEHTGYSGVCVFENLGPEVLNILVGKVGFGPSGARLNAAAGEKTTCNVELIPGGTVSVEIRTVDGIPASGAVVTV